MKSVCIGDMKLEVPIIQGGMGVGISLGNLAGHVAKNGGMGVISTAHPGYRAEDFEKNPTEVNKRELAKEIQKAKEIAKGKGMVAINAMVAITDYAQMVEVAIKNKIDAIISGAGLPMNLPGFVKGTKVKIAPIVSSGKAARLICKTWDRRYHVAPDFVVIEGSEAGGHLGFHKEDVLNKTTAKLADIFKEVKETLQPFVEKYQKEIPIFVAGGVYDADDIKQFMDLGADGVQMATRFICTEECDADIKYKEAFINAKKEDIEIVKSPVGMPGRAIMTKLTERLKNDERIPVKRCYNCLVPCDVKTTPYCISSALINAAKGNLDEGLVFSGSNGYRNDKIVTVKELMDELKEGFK
ncbi:MULTISPECIES: nitronate monooxygenase family protein [unclassified Thomasclavelia]|uniref:Probable nitronate monooxygenase n=1 Tax=Candidatus Erysipelatoclostridium merdavium TaxID=2838566 RepID=A0A9D1XLM4_9FIRM|nr:MULTISPECIES: nitronate monooxygenase family protein [unclassified Thomasclavelia]OUP75272.1 nitronate monooxygenase [Erysipelatoclostridium sp. An173]OUQ08865.1 nitronate monooxygenase [Erysipelatoclostridium sp. An15]HIX81525.1 nitronate monooxygenase family protein [Candidatus Erysipelatoclostridium merdavium]